MTIAVIADVRVGRRIVRAIGRGTTIDVISDIVMGRVRSACQGATKNGTGAEADNSCRERIAVVVVVAAVAVIIISTLVAIVVAAIVVPIIAISPAVFAIDPGPIVARFFNS